MDIAERNDVVFIKRPVYDYKLFGKKYVNSSILLDSTEKFYGNSSIGKTENKRLLDFPKELELNKTSGDRPERETFKKELSKKEIYSKDTTATQSQGFCIRTGKKIKFNPKQPMSKESWKIWNEYGNIDFGEKYCHKTGKPSYGKTSMRNPIL